MKAVAKPDSEPAFRNWIDGFGFLDPNIPLHHQIYMHIKSEILDGLWVGSDGFPGENDLAKKFGVSVITTRTALERLAAEGWIQRGRGQRTQVIRRPEISRLQSPLEMFPVGKNPPYTYKVLFAGIDVGPAGACVALDMELGSRLWLCSRLRTFSGRRHSVTLNAQLPEIGEAHCRSKLERLPMSQILREAGFKTAGLRRRISVGFPPPFVGHHLKIGSQEPILVHTFTLLKKPGGVVEWVRIYVHPQEISPEEVFNPETGEWALTSAL